MVVFLTHNRSALWRECSLSPLRPNKALFQLLFVALTTSFLSTFQIFWSLPGDLDGEGSLESINCFSPSPLSSVSRTVFSLSRFNMLWDWPWLVVLLWNKPHVTGLSPMFLFFLCKEAHYDVTEKDVQDLDINQTLFCNSLINNIQYNAMKWVLWTEITVAVCKSV